MGTFVTTEEEMGTMAGNHNFTFRGSPCPRGAAAIVRPRPFGAATQIRGLGQRPVPADHRRRTRPISGLPLPAS
jgi:hypothetical protein